MYSVGREGRVADVVAGFVCGVLLFRIGFLGLGLMGSGIVSNLLKMGHVVTVWNRTAEKVGLLLPSQCSNFSFFMA